MISSILNNKFAIIGIIVVVLAGAWYGLASSGGSSSSADTGALTSPSADTSGDAEIIQKLNALQSISLTGTVFSNPAYATLKDYTTAIVPEPVGRPDPFAPLSQQAGTQASPAAAKTVQIFTPAH